ncbi:MAG: prepilin-type N-terminal cleavage/methylation domain-containing protein [Gemmatimonadota bacterium]|nr:MAG: prepilin-type N-terminal cleavage/methylation domain-containing protein [Gemmatimonadota bacterium]
MRSSERGFTLAELLVALAVTGLVVAAAHGGLTAIADGAARSRAAREPVIAGAAGRALLESWLRAAGLPEGAGPFQGTHPNDPIPSDELSFAVVDAGSLRPGPHRVRLWVDRDELTPGRGLLAEITPILGGGAAVAETLAIAPLATGLSLRYLVEIGGRKRWVAEWESEAVLPEAVELQLSRLARVRLGAADDDGIPPLLMLPIVVPMGAGQW